MSELLINTTQNVAINFKSASVGQRMGAYFIDLLIKIAYGIVIYYLFFKWLGLGAIFSGSHGKFAIVVVLFFSLPVIFYSLLLESIFEGQTFGKKLRKIKVIKIDGYQASFVDYVMRWFFRLVDVSVCSGVVALISVTTSKKHQRLGDMVAGTAVISLENDINISHTILEEIGSEYQPTFPSVIKFTDNDIRIIKESFKKANDNKDVETVDKLITKIETVIQIKNEFREPSQFIDTIIKDYNYYTQNM